MILLLMLLFAAAGCGGGGGSQEPYDSPYAGKWYGNWTGQGVGSGSGTVYLVVAQDGKLSGVLSGSDSGIDAGVISGTSNNATFSLSYSYPGSSTYTMQGTWSQDGSRLMGAFSQGSGSGTFDLAAAGDNLYRGTYYGSWTISSLGINGNMDVTLAADGAISGSLTSILGQGPITGYAGPDDKFSFSVRYPNQPVYVLSGKYRLGTGNNLVGSFTQGGTGTTSNGTFSLTKQASQARPYTLSGYVRDDVANQGVAGIEIQFLRSDGSALLATATTDANGLWTSPTLNEAVQIKPSRDKWSFQPASRNADWDTVYGQDFVGHSLIYTASGYVRGQNKSAKGTVIHFKQSANGPDITTLTVTSDDGSWSKSGLEGTLYLSVTNEERGWYFWPASWSIDSSHYNSINFNGLYPYPPTNLRIVNNPVWDNGSIMIRFAWDPPVQGGNNGYTLYRDNWGVGVVKAGQKSYDYYPERVSDLHYGQTYLFSISTGYKAGNDEYVSSAPSIAIPWVCPPRE